MAKVGHHIRGLQWGKAAQAKKSIAGKITTKRKIIAKKTTIFNTGIYTVEPRFLELKRSAGFELETARGSK